MFNVFFDHKLNFIGNFIERKSKTVNLSFILTMADILTWLFYQEQRYD